MVQISNHIFCEKFLIDLDIKTGILPNPYYDYPYMIIKNFIPKIICESITEEIRTNEDIVEAKVRKKVGVKIAADIDKTIRKTNIHKLNSTHELIYKDNFLKHQSDIERFFNIALTTSTDIQALEYTKGSFYKQHSDDSSVLVKNDKVIGFLPVARQRKISTVLFTTSRSDVISKNTFRGGELVFNYLYDKNGQKVQINPKAGDMLVFLSNPYFTHEVLKVEEGYRVSLVQWHDAIVE
jgi:SM-20-related protein